MRFTHLMLAVWCVAVLSICLCDMGRAAAQLERQEKPAIKTAYAQEAYGGTCSSDLLSIIFRSGTASCLFFNGQTAPGSDFSSWSRCFSSSDGLTLSDGSSVTAICAHVHCNTKALTYSLEIKGGHENAPCITGAKVDLKSFSPLFKSGTITCPRYDDVCSNMPTTTTTTPTPTTTTTYIPTPTSTFPHDSVAMSYTTYSTLPLLGLLFGIICIFA